MSRITTWALGLAWATVLVLVGSAFSLPAQAAAADPTPPTQIDPCQRDQDGFLIPEAVAPVRGYGVDGAGVSAGWNSAESRSSVTIEAYGRDSEGKFVIYGSWTFTYTNAVCGEPAADTFDYRIGTCDPSTGLTGAEAMFGNTDDPYDRWVERVDVIPTRSDTLGNGSVWLQVFDGESRWIPLGDDGRGLYPGTWRLDISYADTPGDVAVFHFQIPSCGNEDPPYGDPMNPGTGPGPGDPTGPGPVAKKPTGKLSQVGSGPRMRVKAINRGVKRWTKFVLVVDPKQGKTVRKNFSVAPNKVKAFTWKNKSRGARPGTVYILKAQVKSTKGPLVWKVVARKRATA